MKILESDYFKYKNAALVCEKTPVKKIVSEIGTPVYIYSRKYFIDRFEEFQNAFRDVRHSIYYAAKSNFNLNVIKIFTELGSGVDVNSEGELLRALKAGANPQKIILTGVGKTPEEIRLALEHKVKMIKAESLSEIYLVDKIAAQMNLQAPLAIRVNPDVDPKTHPYVSTGLAESKFGIDAAPAEEVFIIAGKLKNIDVTGIDMHIGSQITSVEPFVEAVEKLASLAFKLKTKGIHIKHFDVGGGFGVNYNDERSFSITELAEAISPILKKLDCEIIFEPGRFFTANGGILVTKVLYAKENRNKNFIIVDAAMNDLLRPSIYNAYHHIQPVKQYRDRNDIIADIVGPVCESGDFFAKGRNISSSKSGELLAVLSAGAYGMVMASNYNARRKPAEVIVDGNKFFVVRSRETYDHLLWDEKIVL